MNNRPLRSKRKISVIESIFIHRRLSAFIGGFIFAWAAVSAAGEEPARGLASISVPEGFAVELAAPAGVVDYPMLAVFDDRGRLFVTESIGKDKNGKEMAAERECIVRLIEDRDGDGFFEANKIFAGELSLPMGALWHRGSLYVAAPPDFVRLDDKDGDGVSESREVILTGWNVLNTASLHGPFLGRDGWLYLTHGRHGYKIETKEGATLEGLAARIWRCRPDGTGLERVCGGGFDNPVELIFTGAGEMIGTMTYFTDPRNGQRDALQHWVLGGVYSKPHECVSEFKRTGDFMPVMTKFARIAPAGLMQYRGAAFGAEYRGDLFSAQFNPHRVQRHKLIREGATFRTEDEDFFTSSDPDLHPTDVLEDADGSLLVVETGGWYRDACPLSKVSKPDIRGAIYRVRREGAAKIEDPRGLALGMEKMAPGELARLLEDPRPSVQDRAQERLAELGESEPEETREALAAALKKSRSSDARLAALWGLARVGTPEAAKLVRARLTDRDPLVRAAAANAAGTLGDAKAARRLAKMARKNEPAARREAAAALGRLAPELGAKAARKAAEGLLRAAGAGDERHIEHAITYSLIVLNQPEPARKALASRRAGERRAALVALDQMDAKGLRAEDIRPFLEAREENLRKAGLWVATHHPEWSGEVQEYLTARLEAREPLGEDAAAMREALLAFAGDEKIQARVAELLAQPGLAADRRMFLLNALADAPMAKLPEPWAEALGAQLGSPDADARARAVAIVRSRGLETLDAKLGALAASEGEAAGIRLAALAALAPRRAELAPAEFGFAAAQLESEDPGLRLAAAQLLGASKLSAAQLAALAGERVAKADALVLPALLGAFEKAPDEEAGRALVAALAASPVDPNLLGQARLEKLLAAYPEPVRAAAAPLMERAKAEAEARTAKLAALEPLLTGGDVTRGRRLFYGEKLACATCHAIGKEGGTLGPDLTSIGAIRSGRDILEAIVFPNATFVQGYEPVRVTARGEEHAGILGEQTAEAIVVKTGANAEARIPRAAIESISPSTVSVMPEGLDTGVSQAELIDLLAFLQAQNGEEWLLPERRTARAGGGQ